LYLNPNCVQDFNTEESSKNQSVNDLETNRDMMEFLSSLSPKRENECSTPNSESTNVTANASPLHSQSFINDWDNKEKSEKLNHTQNPRKNIPGLVLQKLRSSIFALIDPTKRTANRGNVENLGYIKEILSAYDEDDIENLHSHLSSYDKNWKTWTKIEEFLKRDRICEKILREIIEAFLNEKGVKDFQSWIKEGKMNLHTKEVIQSSRDWMLEKFEILWKEDHIDNYEPNRNQRGYKKFKTH